MDIVEPIHAEMIFEDAGLHNKVLAVSLIAGVCVTAVVYFTARHGITTVFNQSKVVATDSNL